MLGAPPAYRVEKIDAMNKWSRSATDRLGMLLMLRLESRQVHTMELRSSRSASYSILLDGLLMDHEMTVAYVTRHAAQRFLGSGWVLNTSCSPTIVNASSCKNRRMDAK
jgi:hypothetical protein